MSEQSKPLYPMTFYPFAEKVSWGGNSLVKNYSKAFYESDSKGKETLLTDSTLVGESWEISDMGFRDSIVKDGWLSGNAISDVMDMYMDRLVGEKVFSTYGRQFPVLIKILDVKGRTPLLVHPDDELSVERYDSLGKTKLWYIIDAEPGSKIYLGFKDDLTATDLYTGCLDNSILSHLNVKKPIKGQSFLINPGDVHCAEGGLIIAEIAEASDLDFKLCNWGKPTENDSDESLTVVEAMDFVNYSASKAMAQSSDKACLADIPQFTVNKISLIDPLKIESGSADSFVAYLCIGGEASIQVSTGAKTDDYVIKAGETVLVPAEISEYFLVPRERNTTLLEVMTCQKGKIDPYINLDVEPTLPGEEDFNFLSPEQDPTDDE